MNCVDILYVFSIALLWWSLERRSSGNDRFPFSQITLFSRTFQIQKKNIYIHNCILSLQLNKWDSAKFYSIKPKLDIGLFVDFCVFTCFYQFLHEVIIKLFLFWSAEQFCDHLMQKLVKAGKNTEINKQYNVNFLLNSVNWIKLGAVSYLLSCNQLVLTKHKVFLAGFKVVITVVQNDSSVIND